MWDFVRDMEEIYIILYCVIILWINISYLKDYKNIRRGLAGISSEDELTINPGAWTWLGIALIFNFFRRWLLYLFAVVVIGNKVVIVISSIFFAISLYDTLFNHSLAKVKKSFIPLSLAVIDIVFVFVLIVYLLFF